MVSHQGVIERALVRNAGQRKTGLFEPSTVKGEPPQLFTCERCGQSFVKRGPCREDNRNELLALGEFQLNFPCAEPADRKRVCLKCFDMLR